MLTEVEPRQIEYRELSKCFGFLRSDELLGSEIERQALCEVTVKPLLPRLGQGGLPKPLQPLDTVGFALHVPTVELAAAHLSCGPINGALKGRCFDDPRRERSRDPRVGVVTNHARLPSSCESVTDSRSPVAAT